MWVRRAAIELGPDRVAIKVGRLAIKVRRAVIELGPERAPIKVGRLAIKV